MGIDHKLQIEIIANPKIKTSNIEFDAEPGYSYGYCNIGEPRTYQLEIWSEKWGDQKENYWIGASFSSAYFFNKFAKELEVKNYSKEKVPVDPNKLFKDDDDDNVTRYIGFYVSTSIRNHVQLVRKKINEVKNIFKKTEAMLLERSTGITESPFRVGHSGFAEEIYKVWNKQCAITGIKIKQALIASHISSWVSDKKNRWNKKNGICLSSTLDKLFDKHLISFSNKGGLLISKTINKKDQQILGISTKKRINVSLIDKILLSKHMKKFEKEEKKR